MINGLCSRCGVSRDVKPLYRNGLKGIDVDWCCIDCVDPQYIPNQSTVDICNVIVGAPVEKYPAPTNLDVGKPQEPATNSARDEICPQCKKYALIIGSKVKLCTKCGYASSSGQTSKD